jgi:fructose PTS system EIIBC or EIIC component
MPQGTPFKIEPEHLTLGLDAKTPGQIVDALIASLGDDIDAVRKTQLAQLVMAREAEASTFIGKETCLPHARTSLVSRLTIAACVAKEPVEWDASGNKARLMFFMAIPKTAIEEYLQTVRTLTRALKNQGVVEKLCASPDKETFIGNLEKETAAVSAKVKA